MGDVMKKIKVNFKSEKAFTMQDLIIAILIIGIFVALIGNLMYNSYMNKVVANLTAQMSMYSVEILEDIDKISYEEVQTKTPEQYRAQFAIPDGFDIKIEIRDYIEGQQEEQDLMKIVKLTLSYTIQGKKQDFVVERLKIKEL